MERLSTRISLVRFAVLPVTHLHERSLMVILDHRVHVRCAVVHFDWWRTKSQASEGALVSTTSATELFADSAFVQAPEYNANPNKLEERFQRGAKAVSTLAIGAEAVAERSTHSSRSSTGSSSHEIPQRSVHQLRSHDAQDQGLP